MICECGHQDSEHGPEGSDRMCSLCLCDDFRPVLPEFRVVTSLSKLLEAVRNVLGNGPCPDHADNCPILLVDIAARDRLQEALDEFTTVG